MPASESLTEGRAVSASQSTASLEEIEALVRGFYERVDGALQQAANQAKHGQGARSPAGARRDAPSTCASCPTTSSCATATCWPTCWRTIPTTSSSSTPTSGSSATSRRDARPDRAPAGADPGGEMGRRVGHPLGTCRRRGGRHPARLSARRLVAARRLPGRPDARPAGARPAGRRAALAGPARPVEVLRRQPLRSAVRAAALPARDGEHLSRTSTRRRARPSACSTRSPSTRWSSSGPGAACRTVDACLLTDDWGTQTALMISPGDVARGLRRALPAPVRRGAPTAACWWSSTAAATCSRSSAT